MPMATVNDLTMYIVEVVKPDHDRVWMSSIMIERFRYVHRYKATFGRANPKIPILVTE
jgi:hypothetical protein